MELNASRLDVDATLDGPPAISCTDMTAAEFWFWLDLVTSGVTVADADAAVWRWREDGGDA